MAYGVKIEVWGEYALFSRPELKTERYSYDCITPSAARGLIEAIYWHPGLRWHIDRIHVCAPIQFTNVRRNEVKSKILASNVRSVMTGSTKELYISTSDDIQQRAATLLRDVRYVIEAHFDLTDRTSPTDNHGKFKEIIRRRLEKGQCYHQPCFGCREFPAHFRAFPEEAEVPVPEEYQGRTVDLGFMLYDLDYSNPRDIQPMFFRAQMVDGTVEVSGQEVLR